MMISTLFALTAVLSVAVVFLYLRNRLLHLRLQNGANVAVEVMQSGLEKAQDSVSHAQQAGHSIDSITSMVDTIREMNAQIATAAEYQRQNAQHIATSIESIRIIGTEATQGSLHIAQASQNLAQLAASQQGHVGKFRLS